MLHDYVKINVKAGDGGQGMVAFRREKFVPMGGPSGGDGGRGSHIIFCGDSNLRTLVDFKYRRHYKGQKGDNGGAKNMTGGNAEDLRLKVPLGTVIRDEEGRVLADIISEDQEIIVAQGGRGGFGNSHFSSGRNKAPEFAEKGEPGEERWLILELKLLADVGLIGMPNAGKSTLISKVSAANPKIANYPFTTLEPNLGLVRLSDEADFVMADLPGLIEGAATGIGLGHRFLRHAERCRVLVHLLDMNPFDEERSPEKDFAIIQEELRIYREDFTSRPLLVVANKMDMPEAEANLAALKAHLGQDYEIMAISALNGQGLQELLWRIHQLLQEAPPIILNKQEDEVKHTIVEAEDPFIIERDDSGTWHVKGSRVIKLVEMTDLNNEAAVLRMQRIFIKMGLEDALKTAGVSLGDTVNIAGNEFEYAE